MIVWRIEAIAFNFSIDIRIELLIVWKGLMGFIGGRLLPSEYLSKNIASITTVEVFFPPKIFQCEKTHHEHRK